MVNSPLICQSSARAFNLRAEPFETSSEGWDNWKWRIDRAFLMVPAQQYIGKFLATFKEFPPSQRVGSFSLDDVMRTLQTGRN